MPLRKSHNVMVGYSAHVHALGVCISSIQLPVRFSFFKLHCSYGRCEFWAGYGMVQVAGAISSHPQAPCHACVLVTPPLRPWPMGLVRGRAMIMRLIVNIPHILYHSTHFFATTSAITALSLCTQSPLLTCTSSLLHNQEYVNLLNSTRMGISLLIISDFESQCMTHAYSILSTY